MGKNLLGGQLQKACGKVDQMPGAADTGCLSVLLVICQAWLLCALPGPQAGICKGEAQAFAPLPQGYF